MRACSADIGVQWLFYSVQLFKMAAEGDAERKKSIVRAA